MSLSEIGNCNNVLPIVVSKIPRLLDDTPVIIMSTQSAIRSTKAVKRLEKPRPLKLSNANRHSTIDGRVVLVEDIMALVDTVSNHIVNGNYDRTLQIYIVSLCSSLKMYGQQLEAVFKDQLDRAFFTFRNGCRDDRLDLSSRVRLLELIELRATNWLSCDNMNSYYKPKISTIDVNLDLVPVPDTPTLLGVSQPLLGQTLSPSSPQPPLLNPGEVLKTSGKFAKPTKIPGKNYSKDEVVIRNSDSGKVMGIKGRRVHMIEELSETIISFQRVNPGAKERLVQITGPSEEKINHAKQLIEDTIRRNASPVRLEQPDKERVGGSSSSLNSSASDDSNRLSQGVNRTKLLHSFSTNDASLGEYKYTVTVGNQSIKITGPNLDLVRTAKLVLDEYFAGEPEQYLGAGDFFTTYEEEPSTPSATTVTSSSRVGSLDSGATSESEETYKAPLATQTESTVDDAGNNLVVVRQPLFPDASKQAFEQAELSDRAIDLSARNRRAFFAHTSSQHQPSTGESVTKMETDSDSVVSRMTYSRDVLLHCAVSLLCNVTPLDWDRISKECPAIVKKSPEFFDAVAYAQKWQEMDVFTSVLSATDAESPDLE